MNLQAEIAGALAVVVRGGVAAIPTDTLYGLAADAVNAAAVERVYEVKGRPAEMPLPVLVSGWEQAAAVADTGGAGGRLGQRLAAQFWPGPLTLVLPAQAGLPARLTGGRDTIAVRMPAHGVPLALARGLGRPITGTSANRSGEADIMDPEELRRCLGGSVDGMITGGARPAGTASTIVEVSGGGLMVLREGALSYAAIRDAAGI